MEVEVIKTVYAKSFKDIEVLDNGVVKKMQQIEKKKSDELRFTCEKSYYDRYLAGNSNYRLADKKDSAKKDADKKDSAKAE